MENSIVKLNMLTNLSNMIILYHPQSNSRYSVSKHLEYFKSLVKYNGVDGLSDCAIITDEIKHDLDVLLGESSHDIPSIADYYGMLDHDEMINKLVNNVNKLPINVVISLAGRKNKCFSTDKLLLRNDLDELINEHHILNHVDGFDKSIYEFAKTPICCAYVKEFYKSYHDISTYKECCLLAVIDYKDVIFQLKKNFSILITRLYMLEGVTTVIKMFGYDKATTVSYIDGNLNILYDGNYYNHNDMAMKIYDDKHDKIKNLRFVVGDKYRFNLINCTAELL